MKAACMLGFFYFGAGTPIIGDVLRSHTEDVSKHMSVKDKAEEKIVKNRKPGVTASRV